MKKLVLALVLGLAAQAAGAVMLEQRPLYREGEVLVRYRASALDAAAQKLRASHGLVSRGVQTRNARIELLQVPPFTTTADAIAVLRQDPAIELAEPNYLRYPRINCPDNAAFFCPNDAEFDEQWGLRSTGQLNYASSDPALASIPGADMDMLLAWDPGADGTFERVGDASVVIAVIDDGISLTHPDLIDNLVPGFDFSGANDPNPSHGSGQGHGTLVAGAAGAKGNNGIGVAGTAWNAKIMPLRFDFTTAAHLEALDHARDNGATIINASFGGPGFSQAEEDAIAALEADGIIYIASAGNDDSNTDVARLNYPANYDASNIVSVAATNRQDKIASFSQYGAISTDIAAPGLQIVTTQAPNAYSMPVNCTSTGNCGISGTSFSAPYVAGIAALIKSTYPSASVNEIKARLIESAEPGDEVNLRTAGGRVNAYNALQMAPRPALVITAIDWVDANDALDPGESLSVDITVQNLWQDATTVSGTLAADNHVTVTSGAVGFGTIASGATATARFDLDVDAGLTQHHYVHFTLDLTADGGYTAARGFIGEIGALQNDTLVTQAFAARSVDLYDEFHAWHYDFDGTLPPGHTQLVFETTSTAANVNSPDIDLLLKKTVPPDYSITVGINPETSFGFFCTSGTAPNCDDPLTGISAGASGTELIAYNNPTAGTYHAVVVNFAQLESGLTYTLRVYTRAAPTGGGLRSSSGGLLGPSALALLLFAALGRRTLHRR